MHEGKDGYIGIERCLLSVTERVRILCTHTVRARRRHISFHVPDTSCETREKGKINNIKQFTLLFIFYLVNALHRVRYVEKDSRVRVSIRSTVASKERQQSCSSDF